MRSSPMRPMRLPDGDLVEGEVHALVGQRFLATLCYGDEPIDPEQLEHRWLRQPQLFADHAGGAAVYFLLDEAVDGYLSVIEELEDRSDALEDAVTGDQLPAAGPNAQERIFKLKREVVRLRRVVSPLRQGLDLIQEEPWLVGVGAPAVLPRRDRARDPGGGARRQHARPADVAARAAGGAERRTS